MITLRYVLAPAVFFVITCCSSVTVSGGVSGGSSSDIDVGIGVGIELLTDPASTLPENAP